MNATWRPFRESVRVTLIRTLGLAAIIGAVLAMSSGGGPKRWPVATLLALWPSLGGHFVELWYLNWLRPRLPAANSVQIIARLIVWFVGGIVLMMGMCATAPLLSKEQFRRCPAWWVGGLAFVGIELVVHLVIFLVGRRSREDFA